jgi:hypothetical protein
VRLTANGETKTQPITIKLDPRVKITPEVRQIFTLTAQVENEAKTAASAYKQARETIEELEQRPQSDATDSVIKKLQELAPVESQAAETGGGFGGFGPAEAPAVTPTLANISRQLIAAVMGLQASEMPPTATQLEACKKQESAYSALMAKWFALKASTKGPAPKPAPVGGQ